MLSLIKQIKNKIVSDKKEVEPFYLQDGFPDGFNYFFREECLRNAFEVVLGIKESLQDYINNQVAPNPLNKSVKISWERDHIESQSICNRINSLIEEIKSLSGFLQETSLLELAGERRDEAIQRVENFVNIATGGIDLLKPRGPQTLVALNALADTLHIARRSIPKVESMLDYKNSIANARDYVINIKSQIESNIGVSNIRASVAKIKTENSSKVGAEDTSNPKP